ISEAQERAERSQLEAERAGKQARENERDAKQAQLDAEVARVQAERSRMERERAADLARRQKDEFERLLREAESETKKAKVNCAVLGKKDRIQSGGCPPGDPLCSNLDLGNVGSHSLRLPPLPGSMPKP
ncbi:MAG: hypothetical protein ABI193_04720, partial [Minicystis sp.]